MLLVKWREEVKADILEIIGFIAERNEQAAYDLQDRIERSLEHLPNHPYLYKPSLCVAGASEFGCFEIRRNVSSSAIFCCACGEPIGLRLCVDLER